MTSKTNHRFSVEREVSLITNKVVKLELVDEIGDLPKLSFTDPIELHEWEEAFMKEWTTLKNELQSYYHAFDCSKCSYHDYDYNYDEFNIDQKYEVCTKGNYDSMLNNHSCSEWEKL